jgi:hypothetical protein
MKKISTAAVNRSRNLSQQKFHQCRRFPLLL